MTMTPEQIEEAAIEAATNAFCDNFNIEPHVGESTFDRAQKIVTAAIDAYEKAMWRPIEEAPHGYLLQVAWLNTLGKVRTTFARYYPAGSLEAFDSDDADENGYAPKGWYEDPGEREVIYPWEPPAGAMWRWPDYSHLSSDPQR